MIDRERFTMILLNQKNIKDRFYKSLCHLKTTYVFILIPLGLCHLLTATLAHAKSLPEKIYIHDTILQSVILGRKNATQQQMRFLAQQVSSLNSSKSDDDNNLLRNQLITPPSGELNNQFPGLFTLPKNIGNDISDSNGVRFAYCPFDPNGNSNLTRLDGKNTLQAIAFVIIGAGQNGRFDTINRCNQLLPYIDNENTLVNFLNSKEMPRQQSKDDIFLIYTNERLTFAHTSKLNFGDPVNNLDELNNLKKDIGVKIGQIRLVIQNNQFFRAVSPNINQFNWEPVSGKWLIDSEKVPNQDTINLNLNSGSLGIGFNEQTKQFQQPTEKKAILNIANHTDTNKYLSGIAFQNEMQSNLGYLGVSHRTSNLFEIQTNSKSILNFTADGTLTIGNPNNPATFSAQENILSKPTTLKETLTVEAISTFEEIIHGTKSIDITGQATSDSLTINGPSTFQNRVTITQGGLNVFGGIVADYLRGDGRNITNLKTSQLIGEVSIRNGGTGLYYIPNNNEILIGNGLGYDRKTINSTHDQIEFVSTTNNVFLKLADFNRTPGNYGSSDRIPTLSTGPSGRTFGVSDQTSSILPINFYIQGRHNSEYTDLGQAQFRNNANMTIHLNLNRLPLLSRLNQDVSNTSNSNFTQITANQINAYLNGTANSANQLNKTLRISINGNPQTHDLNDPNNTTANFNFNLPRSLITFVNQGEPGKDFRGSEECDDDPSKNCDISHEGGRGGIASISMSQLTINNSVINNTTNPIVNPSTIKLQSLLFKTHQNLNINGNRQTIQFEPADGFYYAALLNQNLNTTNQPIFQNFNIKNTINLKNNGEIISSFLDVLNQASVMDRLLIQKPSASNPNEGSIEISGRNAKITIGDNTSGLGYLQQQIVLDSSTETIETKYLSSSERIHTPKQLTVGVTNNQIKLISANGNNETKNLIARNQITSPLMYVNNGIYLGPNSNFPTITLDAATNTITTKNLIVNGSLNLRELTLGESPNQIVLDGNNGLADFKNISVSERVTGENINATETVTVGKQIILNATTGKISALSIINTGNISVGLVAGNQNNRIMLEAVTGQLEAKQVNITGTITAGSGPLAVALNAGNGNISSTNLSTSGNIRAGSGTSTTSLNTTSGTVITSGVTLTSDANLKENIQPINSGHILERLQALTLYNYNFQGESISNRHLGLLAQEVLPLFPEAVNLNTDGALKGYYSVNYNMLSAAAAVGVGELHRKTSAWQLHLKNPETLSTLLPNFIVSNLTTQTIETEKLKAKHIEANKGNSEQLEAQNFTAINSQAKHIQSDTLNSGYAEGFAGLGGSLQLFTAANHGQYLVNVSANDGSYATANVFVAGGQVHVVPMAAFNIQITSLGNNIHAVTSGKSLKASWIRMG